MLTVLLATKNRAGILRNVLEAYCHLQPPPSGWKLVVVDNGSKDETGQVIASFTNRLPVQSVHEPKSGKNVALNTGLGLVEGDLTILTDDDAFPAPNWLLELRKAADAQPAYSMFGGTVVPRWEVPPPAWIAWVDQELVYALTSPSLVDGPIAPFMVVGPNMAIRASIFQSGTCFDPSIGPRGSNYPMGSETELLLRLARQGHQSWHVRSAVVEHFIRKEQLEKVWVLQRGIRCGRGRHRLSRNAKLWVGIPRHLFRDLPKEAVRVAVAGIFFRQEALLRSRWRFNILRGIAIEARTMARERRAQEQLTLEGVRRQS
jgi:glycosyltransferase involved in cell wall biosynthesis